MARIKECMCVNQKDILKAAGINVTKIQPIFGGKNNRVWKVEASKCYLLKEYISSKYDTRDRKGHELKLLTYAAEVKIAEVPKIISPLTGQYALFEFIQGTAPKQISLKDIDRALAFLTKLNSSRFENNAKRLPMAADACFTTQEHLNNIAFRIQRLDEIQDTRVASLVKEIKTAWRKWEPNIQKDSTLPITQRCISPSDFGFHNSIRSKKGLIFIDFEYSGWDDPVKLIIDFCYQPDQILPKGFSEYFIKELLLALNLRASIASRIKLLGRAYLLKWACICLNNFLPSFNTRIYFTRENRKETDSLQMFKARHMLELAISLDLA